MFYDDSALHFAMMTGQIPGRALSIITSRDKNKKLYVLKSFHGRYLRPYQDNLLQV